jgi:hypothetical protein
MPTINRLSALDTLQGGDQIPVYDQSNGDARKSSLTLLSDYVQSTIPAASVSTFTTQKSSPAATGFSVNVTDTGVNVHLILTPAAGYAVGTIILPQSITSVDMQEVLVNCTKQVTTFVVNGNGAAISGAPTSLAADAFFRMKFDAATATWFRVG